jgi:hypothetical protein
MPKTTTFLVGRFCHQVDDALDLARAADGAVAFMSTRRMFVYEAAYLLAFSAWESFLEQAFLRFMCGYRNAHGTQSSTGTWVKASSLADAYTKLRVLSPRNPQYLLWHGPALVINRSRLCFVNGAHEMVIASAQTDIEDFAAVRHHVAHRSEDTEKKFQNAALRLSGSTVLGGRAGRFLRARTTDPVTGDDVSWLERICVDLQRYASQIAS